MKHKTLLILAAVIGFLTACETDPETPTIQMTVQDKCETGASIIKLTGIVSTNATVSNLYVQCSSNSSFSTSTETEIDFNKSTFTATITNLNPLTTYYYRYRVANKLSSYTEKTIRTVKTKDYSAPKCTTSKVVNISYNTATCECELTDDGGRTITERGVCYSKTNNSPTVNDTRVITAGSAVGAYSCNLSNLTENTRYIICAYAKNSTGISYGETIYFWTKQSTGTENGYTWVDLGLSVKWATCNIGSSTPEGYGNYFAWGEITTKSNYAWSTYKYCNGSSTTMTKYCAESSYGTVDNRTALVTSDDVAYKKWGGNWRMPTNDELYELRTKCTWEWTYSNSVYGYRVKSKVTGNNNSIFLPAAGKYVGTTFYKTEDDYDCNGTYWSKTLYNSASIRAYSLWFSSGYIYGYANSIRYAGFPVRAVCP